MDEPSPYIKSRQLKTKQHWNVNECWHCVSWARPCGLHTLSNRETHSAEVALRWLCDIPGISARTQRETHREDKSKWSHEYYRCHQEGTRFLSRNYCMCAYILICAQWFVFRTTHTPGCLICTTLSCFLCVLFPRSFVIYDVLMTCDIQVSVFVEFLVVVCTSASDADLEHVHGIFHTHFHFVYNTFITNCAIRTYGDGS